MIQVGEQVGDYRVERLLGHGGMAEVWLVRHAVLGSHYALKCLQAHSTATVARLLQEGRAQAQMRFWMPSFWQKHCKTWHQTPPHNPT